MARVGIGTILASAVHRQDKVTGGPKPVSY